MRKKSLSEERNLKKKKFNSPFLSKLTFVKKLNRGAFSKVFVAEDKKHGKMAVKFLKSNTLNLYEREVGALSALKKYKGFPYLHSSGKEEESYYIAMSLLGDDLQKIFEKKCVFKLDQKTIVHIAHQMIKRLEAVHLEGFLHCDLKPENIMMDRTSDPIKKNHLYLVDFGLSCKWASPSGDHIPFAKTGELIGSLNFCSVNAMMGFQLSRRDDIESLGYILLYLYSEGKLPWNNLNLKKDLKSIGIVREMKREILYDHANTTGLPKELRQLFDHVSKLTFYQKPDYNLLRAVFRNAVEQNPFAEHGKNIAISFDNHLDCFLKPFEEIEDHIVTEGDDCLIDEKDFEGPASPARSLEVLPYFIANESTPHKTVATSTGLVIKSVDRRKLSLRG